MKKHLFRRLFVGSIMLLSVLVIAPSCGASAKSQRQTLMIQDKAEYSRNKKHFKGSKSYKKQKKRHRMYKKH